MHCVQYKQHGRNPPQSWAGTAAKSAVSEVTTPPQRLSRRTRIPTAKACSASLNGSLSPRRPRAGGLGGVGGGRGGDPRVCTPDTTPPLVPLSGGSGRPGSRPGGPSPHRLGGAAEASQQKRLRMFRAAAEDQAASLKTEVLAELEHAAAVARSSQEEASQATVQWAALPPSKVGSTLSCLGSIAICSHAK